ncbi:unnamed protein product, partial [Ectocarpus fasciculatus]
MPSTAKNATKVLRTSQRTGCGFKVTIRWPKHGPGSANPYLSETMILSHEHTVDKDATTLPRSKRKSSKDSLVTVQPEKLPGSEATSPGDET